MGRNSSQSPRASRASTNDPERWSKGSVSMGMDDDLDGTGFGRKSADAINSDVVEDLDRENARYLDGGGLYG